MSSEQRDKITFIKLLKKRKHINSYFHKYSDIKWFENILYDIVDAGNVIMSGYIIKSIEYDSVSKLIPCISICIIKWGKT